MATVRAVFDGPANVLDTSRNYGLGRSEQRIGRYLGARRDGVALSTKLGYGVPGVPDGVHWYDGLRHALENGPLREMLDDAGVAMAAYGMPAEAVLPEVSCRNATGSFTGSRSQDR